MQVRHSVLLVAQMYQLAALALDVKATGDNQTANKLAEAVRSLNALNAETDPHHDDPNENEANYQIAVRFEGTFGW